MPIVRDRLVDLTDYDDVLGPRDGADGFPGLNASGHLVGTLIARKGTAAALAAVVLAEGEFGWVTDTKTMLGGDGTTAGGIPVGGLTSAAVVSVRASGTPTENGTALLAAYATAKLLTPGGAALSATHRVTVYAPPADYDLGSASLTLDTQFVDLLGGGDGTYIHSTGHVLRQTANDVWVEGLYAKCLSLAAQTNASTDPAAYAPDANLTSARVRSCRFSGTGTTGLAMRTYVEYSGEYVDVTCNGFFGFGSASLAFSAAAIASGTFIRCRAETGRGFGHFGTASGTFTFCTSRSTQSGVAGSFGAGASAVASGLFVGCVADEMASFGGSLGTASGTFDGCFGRNGSFGGGTSFLVGTAGVMSGKMIGCTLVATSTYGNAFGPIITGKMVDSTIDVTGITLADVCRVGAGGKVIGCTLLGGSTNSVNATSAATSATVVGLLATRGIGANVTNTVASPGNVIDTNIT